jgi:hypothetical protein
MSRVLVITFEVVPEVSKYMATNSVDLSTALRSMGMDITDGVDTRLKIVDENTLSQYGKEDDDYVIVRGMDTLEFWGYSLDEVCEDLNVGLEDLRDLGVDVGIEEPRY